MPDAKLKFNEQELTIGEGVVSFGRASDNSVSFADDANVSRYHAEIENRGGDLWLIDLGSSNGTTVNDAPLKGETMLNDGDRIAFGGTSVVEVEFVNESEPKNAGAAVASVNAAESANPATATAAAAPTDAEAVSKAPKILLIAGAVCGLAVIGVFAAGLIYYTQSSSACAAKAFITSPESGDTLIKAAEIEVEVENGECVSRAIFTIDGVEFARTSEKPFTATLDPKEFPDLSDGFEHTVQIVLEDESGNKIVQPNAVAVALDTRETVKPAPTPEVVKVEDKPASKTTTAAGKVSLSDVKNMSERLVKQFGGNFSYKVANPQFLAEVQKKTGEYAQEGYYERAARFRDAINVAFVQEQNLDAPLGFILAMSRSKFVPVKQGNDEGLWRMSNDFVTDNAYNGLCGAETLSDQSQKCAATAAALYLKAMVYGVFKGDLIYSAAAFGKSTGDAGVWAAGLPADRSDFWNAIKTQQEREQIVRFFAAGIVAENPQKFGLKKDRPLSELYKVTM